MWSAGKGYLFADDLRSTTSNVADLQFQANTILRTNHLKLNSSKCELLVSSTSVISSDVSSHSNLWTIADVWVSGGLQPKKCQLTIT